RTAFIKTNPSLPVVLATGASAILLAAVPFIPGLSFGLQFTDQPTAPSSLNPLFWPALIGIILGYIVIAELTKRLYMKVNHREWI
ncbi:MAG: hypothetical protein KBS35_00005, partial [Mycoplasma sp.]|nr:hypothetical protein [Candidatus Hennigella equi]